VIGELLKADLCRQCPKNAGDGCGVNEIDSCEFPGFVSCKAGERIVLTVSVGNKAEKISFKTNNPIQPMIISSGDSILKRNYFNSIIFWEDPDNPGTVYVLCRHKSRKWVAGAISQYYRKPSAETTEKFFKYKFLPALASSAPKKHHDERFPLWENHRRTILGWHLTVAHEKHGVHRCGRIIDIQQIHGMFLLTVISEIPGSIERSTYSFHGYNGLKILRSYIALLPGYPGSGIYYFVHKYPLSADKISRLIGEQQTGAESTDDGDIERMPEQHHTVTDTSPVMEDEPLQKPEPEVSEPVKKRFRWWPFGKKRERVSIYDLVDKSNPFFNPFTGKKESHKKVGSDTRTPTGSGSANMSGASQKQKYLLTSQHFWEAACRLLVGHNLHTVTDREYYGTVTGVSCSGDMVVLEIEDKTLGRRRIKFRRSRVIFYEINNGSFVWRTLSKIGYNVHRYEIELSLSDSFDTVTTLPHLNILLQIAFAGSNYYVTSRRNGSCMKMEVVGIGIDDKYITIAVKRGFFIKRLRLVPEEINLHTHDNTWKPHQILKWKYGKYSYVLYKNVTSVRDFF
jgi:hypothetical protein